MGEASKIEWTHHTFNPWRGCAKVSAGCANCYAATDRSVKIAGIAWGSSTPRPLKAESGWLEPLRWNRRAEAAGARERVFCASLADVFEARDDLDAARGRLFEIIEATPSLDWLLLTKRADEIMRRVPERWREAFPRNVWMGVSVEDQDAADKRIPLLLAVPAAVRFLSMEPLLGPVDLWGARYPDPESHGARSGAFSSWRHPDRRIDWVIVGGESGPRARPMDPDWARDLRNQCAAGGVPFFFKQWGGETPAAKKAEGRVLDGVLHDAFPVAR